MATSNYGLLGSLLYEAQNTPPKRRCFISYHHADENEVQTFLDTYSNAEVFTHRALGLDMANDIVKSNDTDYVMRRIRESYMQNTSVTIVMVGQNSWKRRYVDWEIAASLRNGFASPANGLLGIKLSSYAHGIQQYPDRLNDNLRPAGHPDNTPCYARCIPYPNGTAELRTAIEEAYQRRETQRHLINNARERFGYNRT
jgi:hypothetical protein